MGAEQSHLRKYEPETPEERLISLENIVFKVLPINNGQSEFNLDALEMNPTFLDIDKVNEDTTRPLKNVATDFVVNEFFSTEDTLYRFMSYVYNIFSDTLSIYRKERNIAEFDIFFLYKGGNILRIVSREFLLELPSSATREITEFYSQFFKRGDADFTIYINPDLSDYDEIYYEVTLIAYLLQDKIRSWFNKNLTRYFNFFRYNTEYSRQIMSVYLEQFNNAIPDEEYTFIDFGIGRYSANGKDFDYQPNKDTTIRFVDPDEDWLRPVRKAAIAEIKRPDSVMTITHNNSLDFPGGSNEIRSKFNLTRTKFIFTLLKSNGKTQNVGGELIDVSIGHRDDTNLRHFFEDVQANITNYRLDFKGMCTLNFNAYSLPYLTFDLEDILFTQRKYPWIDRKYDKRINRLFYMYFVNIFVSLEGAPTKLQVIKDLRNEFFISLTKISSKNFDVKMLLSNISNFNAMHRDKNLLLNNFMDKMEELLNKIPPDQIDFLQEMAQILLKNADFIIKTISNIRQYCSIDGSVATRDLYTANVSNFV